MVSRVHLMALMNYDAIHFISLISKNMVVAIAQLWYILVPKNHSKHYCVKDLYHEEKNLYVLDLRRGIADNYFRDYRIASPSTKLSPSTKNIPQLQDLQYNSELYWTKQTVKRDRERRDSIDACFTLKGNMLVFTWKVLL